MRRTWIGGVGCVLVVGCGEPVSPEVTVAGTSTGGGGEATRGMSETGVPTSGGSTGAQASTTGAGTGSTGTTTLSTSSSSEVSGGSSSGTTCDFICPTDEMLDDCDLFAQDCPRGEKCTSYANDGGNSWNDTKCVPVMENPQQPGEPCMVEGNGVSGIDNCDLGSYCWDTDAENNGYCVALCEGTIEMPFCEDPKEICAIFAEAVLILCLPGCDPLAQDCDPADLCIDSPSGDAFLCVLDASGEEGQQHDPCEFANSCDAGLLCLDSGAATECNPMASSCCEPFCDLTDPDADMKCGGLGQVCNPYFGEGMAPPGCENVGFCAVPM